jgi:hypothetical protein
MHEHLCTCLYHVQTRMYRFANSCPGGQDSRCGAPTGTVTIRGAVGIVSSLAPLLASKCISPQDSDWPESESTLLEGGPSGGEAEAGKGEEGGIARLRPGE